MKYYKRELLGTPALWRGCLMFIPPITKVYQSC